MGAEPILTQKLLVNFTMHYKEMASNTFLSKKTEIAFFLYSNDVCTLHI